MSRTLGSALVCCSLLTALASHSLGQEARPRPNEAEAKIEAALGEPAKFEFVDQPLADVIEHLTKRHKIAIQIDNKGLTDAGLGSDTPVTAHVKGVTLRSALRLVLNELDLVYVVRDEVLMITTKTEAENMQVFKIYPVRDLVASQNEFRSPRAPDAINGDIIHGEDYTELIELITTCIEPTSWEGSGPSPIEEYRHSHALAFSQTAEIHEEVAALLAALRQARHKQLIAAKLHEKAAEKQPPADPALTMKLKVYRLGRRAQMPGGGGTGGGFFAVADDASAGDKAVGGTAQQPAANPAAPPAAAPATGGRDQASTAASSPPAPPMPGAEQFDRWAKELAEMLPELVAPESWEPEGKGFVRPVAGGLVVRQTEAAHRKIAQLLCELLPEYAGLYSSMGQYEASVRLAVPGPQLDWPQEAEPLPNANEAAVEKALGAKLDLAFVDAPLSDVIDFIRQRTQLDVQVDSKALADAGLGMDTPITRRLVGLTLRAALRLMLDELDLTYVIRNEVLMITTKTESENALVCKVYPVFDLVVRPSDAPQSRRAVDYDSLVQIVRRSVALNTWAGVGGAGAIQPFANAGVLVISQTTEVHEEIVGYLRALREVGADQK